MMSSFKSMRSSPSPTLLSPSWTTQSMAPSRGGGSISLLQRVMRRSSTQSSSTDPTCDLGGSSEHEPHGRLPLEEENTLYFQLEDGIFGQQQTNTVADKETTVPISTTSSVETVMATTATTPQHHCDEDSFLWSAH
jgi:hypothetical protein